MASAVDEGDPAPVPLSTVHEFPVNYFVENIATRPSGPLLVTVHNTRELFQVVPSARLVSIVHVFPTGVMGIVEVEPDVFYISTGEIGAKGTFAVYKVDMTHFTTSDAGDVTTAEAVSKIADIPDALFLNGSTRLQGSDSTILLADSLLGIVWSVNVKTAAVSIWYQDKLLTKVTENPLIPGLNGIKCHDNYIYLSNSDSHIFYRLAITSTGEAEGPLRVVRERVNVDDFAFDNEGSVFLTTHTFQSVLKLSPDGSLSRVAGGPGDATVAGTTACAFGRTPDDKNCLYVTTNGGMSYPVDGKIGPGRVLKVDVGSTRYEGP